MLTIRVYIDTNCLGCQHAELLVNDMRRHYPDVDTMAVHVGDGAAVPESLFALPTWYVNDEIWKLGNPSWDELEVLLR